MADCEDVTSKIGNLVGICPVCDTIMNRRISLAKIDLVRGNLEITFVKKRLKNEQVLLIALEK
jgi:hypothetical protein